MNAMEMEQSEIIQREIKGINKIQELNEQIK